MEWAADGGGGGGFSDGGGADGGGGGRFRDGGGGGGGRVTTTSKSTPPPPPTQCQVHRGCKPTPASPSYVNDCVGLRYGGPEGPQHNCIFTKHLHPFHNMCDGNIHNTSKQGNKLQDMFLGTIISDGTNTSCFQSVI